jgi:Tat protein translocase TatB subunit
MPSSFCLAFVGGSIGPGEWIVLFVVILVVVGPKRLPEVARKVGRMMEMFRRAADEFKDQLMSMDQESPASPPSPSPADTSPAADGETPPDAAGSYNPYPDTADYPGNEGHVENWAAEQEPAQPEPEPDAAVENGGTPKPAETAP